MRWPKIYVDPFISSKESVKSLTHYLSDLSTQSPAMPVRYPTEDLVFSTFGTHFDDSSALGSETQIKLLDNIFAYTMAWNAVHVITGPTRFYARPQLSHSIPFRLFAAAGVVFSYFGPRMSRYAINTIVPAFEETAFAHAVRPFTITPFRQLVRWVESKIGFGHWISHQAYIHAGFNRVANYFASSIGGYDTTARQIHAKLYLLPPEQDLIIAYVPEEKLKTIQRQLLNWGYTPLRMDRPARGLPFR